MRRLRKGPPEHHPLPPRDQMKPGMLIMDLSRLIHDLMREQEHALGIKSGYRMVLFHLNHQKEGVPQSQLVNETHLKPPTVSLALQNMERDGLVMRKTNAADQRETLVCLTEAGRDLDRKLHEGIENVDATIGSALTYEEQQQLIELMLKIRGHICGEN